MRRRLTAILCALALLLPCLSVSFAAQEGEAQSLRCAVLYAGESPDWQDSYSHLEQSLLLNLSVQAVDVSENYTLEGYDLLYPDESVMESPRADALKGELTAFAAAGGALFLGNEFYDFLPLEVVGAAEFVKLDHCPEFYMLTAAEVEGDLAELQGIVMDFASIYPYYTDYERLRGCDYGYAMRPGTAQALVSEGDLALYTMNHYGQGWVFFTNPLLPNIYSVNGFSLESRNEAQVSLASSTASANQLLRNAFAGFISKKKFGYAPYRVFGVLGRPSMAWELHLEDITGMSLNTARPFIEMSREAGQIPSFSLIRSTYYWLERRESVTYVLNQAQSGMEFQVDLDESVYSSGTHIAVGEERQWLSLGGVANAGSYFIDYPEYDQRAYPYAADLNGDGLLDLLCGSLDGNFHFYPGQGYDGWLTLGTGVNLADAGGQALLTPGGYSAPVAWDVDGDGMWDIVAGGGEGKLYWYANQGGFQFRDEGLMLDTGLSGQVFPDVGDWNGDGCPDVMVGSNEGVLRFYPGSSRKSLRVSAYRYRDLSGCLGDMEGDWLAPRMVDFNGDGRMDLAVGTFHGYVARYIQNVAGTLDFCGYITADEPNYKGNQNLKFGNNCVPFFADVNGDGSLDLLAGSLEYGLPYSIDDPNFPYREALQAEVKAIQDSGSYLGLHYYTNVSASPEREAYELASHKKALESYGVDVSRIGCNQHTWHLSANDQTQSFDAMWEAGLLWNSGFEPARSAATPQVSAENVMALPFFLEREGEKTILLQNCSTYTYVTQPWDSISAKYGMPTCVYYHCDWLFMPNIAEEARDKIEQLQNFQYSYQYNFVREDQLMLATAAAYNLTLDCRREGDLLTLTPAGAERDFALYDENYQKAGGARISFSQNVDASAVSTDADVWTWFNGELYIGLNKPTSIYFNVPQTPANHLTQVNLPAVITRGADGVTRLEFQEGGMMQVWLDSPAQVLSEGWTVDKTGRVLTKFGPAETLELVY